MRRHTANARNERGFTTRVVLSLLFAVMFLPAPGIVAAVVEPSVQIAKERHVVEQRRRIKTVQMDLRCSFAVREQSSNRLLDLDSRLCRYANSKILFDGDRRRNDETANGNRVVGPDGSRMVPKNGDGAISQRFVLTPTEYIWRDATEYVGQPQNPVSTGPRDRAQLVEFRFFNVEMLGLIPMPFGLLYRAKVGSFHEVAERSDCQMDEELLDGMITRKSSFLRADGKRVTFWFAPELDDNVIQTEFSMEMRDGRVRKQRVHSKLQKYSAEILFPEECEYSCWHGDELIDHERWVVKEAVFNGPIDPVVFTLAGLDVPVGTFVATVSDSPTVKTWDGEKLTQPVFLPEPKNVAELPAPRQRNLLWLAIANIAGGLFLTGLYFWKRRRVTPGDGGAPKP